MADINLIIDKTKFPPTLKIEVNGMQGEGCVAKVEEVQEILRMETLRTTLKPEFKTVGQRLPLKR